METLRLGPGFETWSLSRFVDPLFAYFVLGMLAVASIIFHQVYFGLPHHLVRG